MPRTTFKHKPPTLSAQDLELIKQLADALYSVKDLPEEDRWQLVMELLPDSYHFRVLLVRKRQAELDAMNVYSALAIVVLQVFRGYTRENKPDPRLIMLTMAAISASSLGELERRHKLLCDRVEYPRDPTAYKIEEIMQFTPRDPEMTDQSVIRDTLMARYVERGLAQGIQP